MSNQASRPLNDVPAASSRALTLTDAAPDVFARLRSGLAAIGFTDAGVCARRGWSNIFAFSPGATDLNDALDVAIQLFFEAASLPQPLVLQHFGAELTDTLLTLGLLDADPARPDRWHAPCSLAPVLGLYFVSDQFKVITHNEAAPAPEDVVFPALASTTGEFLGSLPMTPCNNLLDLGAGTGVAALHAAQRCAGHAWAVDVTERATRIAAFNARLNGITNVTTLTGDLFAPVEGRTFDFIVAHPPYMPEAESRLIFRDGGEDGEQISRRIVQDLPRYLEPGGRFCCRCLGTDRRDEPFEQRLRATLGPAHEEFDILVVTNVVLTTPEYVIGRAHASPASWHHLVERLRFFESLAVERIVIGFVYIDRHGEKRPPITLRRVLNGRSVPFSGSPSWLLAWERFARSADLSQYLPTVRPLLLPTAEVLLTHQMTAGQLLATSCRVLSETPFEFRLESTPALAYLLEACNGSRTVSELYEQMKAIGAIPPNAPIDDILTLVRVLVGAGVLLIEDHPLPASIH